MHPTIAKIVGIALDLWELKQVTRCGVGEAGTEQATSAAHIRHPPLAACVADAAIAEDIAPGRQKLSDVNNWLSAYYSHTIRILDAYRRSRFVTQQTCVNKSNQMISAGTVHSVERILYKSEEVISLAVLNVESASK